jgi:hypothetical protein
VKLLPLNERLFVDRRLSGGWYRVILKDGAYGYVAASHVNTELPEPNARLHRIKGGEHALAIVKQYYKGDAIEWGQDERFYVNVLVLVNEEAGRRGIFKPSAGAAWDETETKAGSQIWIPSVEFAQSMKGKVSSGSLSYEVYQAIKDAAIAVAEFVAGGLAFVAGLLHGALESLWDLLAGLAHLVGMAWDIVKSLLQGEFLSDARRLMEQISKLSATELAEAGLEWLDKKWNDPGLLSRWHFRGWIIGYAVVEILMLVLSDGVLTALKWAGKAGKFSKLLARFPQVTKVVEGAKALKGPTVEKLSEALKGGRAADEAADVGKAAKAGEAASEGTRLSPVMMSKATKLQKVTRREALHELLEEARKAGIHIHTDAEAQRYLDHVAKLEGVAPDRMHAVALGEDIFVRAEHVDNVRVLREELIHCFQQKAGMEATRAAVVAGEIEARLMMIRFRHRWALTNDEIREMIREVRIMRKTGKY